MTRPAFTLGPWEIGFDCAESGWVDIELDGHIIASARNQPHAVNQVHAARIVQCVNAHDELVAAAHAAEAVLARGKWLDTSVDPEAVALRMLRNAIKRAEGGAE